nr:uncharacterized protein LOC109958977 isoform X2 [Monopterus albus]
MGVVLQRAAAWCLCKLACSLVFLPSVATSCSPVSFCCCCLLIFTDFLVSVFLSFFCIFESWLTEQTPLGDVTAVRFLLFLSQVYGGVLLLITPLIAVETLTRLLWLRHLVVNKAESQAVRSDGQCHYTGQVAVQEEDESNISDQGKDQRLFHVVAYLCCLSVWIAVALNVRWQWKTEETLATACFITTNSLIRCLPNLLSFTPSVVTYCWGLAFLSLLLLILTTRTGLHRQHQGTAQMEITHREKGGFNNNGGSCRKDLVPVLPAPSKSVNPGMSVSDPAQSVDPEKTESSCTVHRAYFWNSVQMSARHHGDLVLIFPGCLFAERGGKEHKRTKKGIPLTFIPEEHMKSQYRSHCRWQQRGFPCLGVNVMIGFVSVFAIFVLPLNLTVNILLIRTIEALLEVFLESLLSSAAKTTNTSASHSETLV